MDNVHSLLPLDNGNLVESGVENFHTDIRDKENREKERDRARERLNQEEG